VTAYLFPLVSSLILRAARSSSILCVIDSPGRSRSSSSFGITVRDAVVDQALVGLVLVVGGAYLVVAVAVAVAVAVVAVVVGFAGCCFVVVVGCG
jgi:hypothetical protein